MKKSGLATVVASGMIAGLLGLAAPAQAVAAPTAVASATDIATGIDRHVWLDQIQPKVNVPKVDTTVRHSGGAR